MAQGKTQPDPNDQAGSGQTWSGIFAAQDALNNAIRQNTGSGTDTGNVNINPNSSGYGYNINRTGNVPAGWYGSYSTPSGSLVTIGGGTPPNNVSGGGGGQQASQISRPTGVGGGGGGGGSVGYSIGYQGPMVPKPEYKVPEFQKPDPYKAPEYNAPERDKGEERALRQQYMAPGMSKLRRALNQSILSSRNMDNPNARSMFINKALEGMGAGLSQVAGTAGREASTEANRRYNTELQNYFNKFTALTDEAKTNYQNEWNAAIMDYQQKVWGAQTDYSNQMSTFNQMPLDYRAGEYAGEKSGYSGSPMGYNKWFAGKY